ncbi:putative 4-hydroxybutyrate coenzyme A transferase [Cooperia oncophora]
MITALLTGDNIFVQSIASTPTPLLKGLCEHVKANDLKGIKLHHLIIAGEAPWTAPDLRDRIRSNSLFTGDSLRNAVNEGIADFNSCFLQEAPKLFRKGVIKLNAALIHVSPPDSKGYCSLGVSVDIARAGVANADYVIGLANKNMPRTFGDSVIHSSHIDVLVEDHSFPVCELPIGKISEEEQKIGSIIAENLVDNGATLQMGIGAVPDAALAALKKSQRSWNSHGDVLRWCAGSAGRVRPGKLVVSFVYGTKRLYNFLNNNPLVEFGDVQWVNDPAIIRQNPKPVEVDLTGQVVSDSVGKRFLSGFGGQVDFIRGAAVCNDGLGKPIIALPSVSKKGQSKIVPYIQQGAGVVTSRSHVHYIVTEYGIAQLWGKNMRQRAYELIKIAHPSHRAALEKAAFERLKVMPSAD